MANKNESFDAIILATGYRPNYTDFVETRSIEPTSAEARTAGLYCVGFNNSAAGLLHQIRKEAITTVDEIARRRTSTVR